MHPDAGESTKLKVDVCLSLGVAVYLYLLLFKLPLYPFFYEADQLIFLYNADRMLAGDAMYRDFFQFTFPGGQVLYYLLFSIFGTHYWVLPLAIIAMGTSSFWFLLKVSQQAIGGWLAYLPPFLFVFFGMRWFGLDGSHRMFSPLFVLVAIFVLLRGRSIWHWATAGSLCALASYFTQQRGFVAVASIGVFLLVDNYYEGCDWKEAIRRTVALAGGFVLTITLLCLPFVVSAGWDAFYWSTIEYPATYYRYHEQNNVSGFAAGFRDLMNLPGIGKFAALGPAVFYSIAVPFAPLCFFVLFAVKRRTFKWEYWRTPMLLAVVAAFAVITIANPGHLRYYQLAAPSLLLLFWLIQRIRFRENKEHLVIASVVCALVLFGVFQVYRVQSNENYTRINAPRGTVYAAANEQIGRYTWIAEHTNPGDAVFETTNPYIYFLFGLRNPSRYTQVYPTDYTRPEFVAGTVEDLTKDPPKFILWQNEYNRPDAERSPGDHTGPLATFVRQHYTPVGPVYNVDNNPVQIWEHNNSEPFPK